MCPQRPSTLGISTRSWSRKSINPKCPLPKLTLRRQFGAFASSNIDNVRGAGASNHELQAVCPQGSPGASFYTHEGVLSSSLAFALVKDAFTHPGPADLSRIDVNSVCSNYLAPGLDLEDFLTTESTIPGAGAAILAFKHKIFSEPPIKPYAR